MPKISYSKHLRMFRAEIQLDGSVSSYNAFIVAFAYSSRMARVKAKKQFLSLHHEKNVSI